MSNNQSPQGKLVIIGGGEDREGEMEVLKEFVRLSGGPESARIVVIPAASTEPELQDERYRKAFTDLGVRDFRLLVIDSRRDADRPHATGVVGRATGVFFTGGDQKRLVSLLHETKLDRELHNRFVEGLVIAGTSAGASMMSEVMLDDGDSKECPRA